jgi:hypothetical protein
MEANHMINRIYKSRYEFDMHSSFDMRTLCGQACDYNTATAHAQYLHNFGYKISIPGIDSMLCCIKYTQMCKIKFCSLYLLYRTDRNSAFIVCLGFCGEYKATSIIHQVLCVVLCVRCLIS